MSDRAKIEILGVKRLERKVRHLDGKGARRVLRSGASKAVQILRKFIKKEIPGHAKSIKKAIGSLVRVNKDGAQAKVGINVGKKKGKGYVFYGAMYIQGTEQRETKSGANRGKVKANPVVARGVKAGTPSARKGMKEQMRAKLKEEARKG